MWCDVRCLEGLVDFMTPTNPQTPQTDGSINFVQLDNRHPSSAERAFATWAWSGDGWRAQSCCCWSSEPEPAEGRFRCIDCFWCFWTRSCIRHHLSRLFTIYIISSSINCSLKSKKSRERWLNLHALIWFVCRPPGFVALGGGFNALFFPVSYNSSPS